MNYFNKVLVMLYLVIGTGISLNAQELTDRYSEIDLYICIGQSNMSGRADIEEEDLGFDNNVFLLNNSNLFEVAKNTGSCKFNDDPFPVNYGYNRYSTIRSDKKPQMLNPVYTFGRGMAQYKPDKNIGLIVQGQGGKGLRYWMSTDDQDDCYYKTMQRVTAALETYPNATVKGLLLTIGESNKNATGFYIESKLSQLIDNFRNHPSINNKQLPAYINQLGRWEWSNVYENEHFNTIIAESSISEFYVINAEGCNNKYYAPKDVNAPIDYSVKDRNHFDSEAMRTLGRRFANVANTVEAFREDNPMYEFDLENTNETSTTVDLNISIQGTGWSPTSGWKFNCHIRGVGSQAGIDEIVEYNGLDGVIKTYLGQDKSEFYYFQVDDLSLKSDDLITSIKVDDSQIAFNKLTYNSKDVIITINGGVDGNITTFNYGDDLTILNPTINGLVGDEIEFNIKSRVAPEIFGLPDVWVSHAFRETIFMSSKSITPGTYKPAIRHSTRPHTSRILGDFIKWDSFMYAPESVDQKYAPWEATVVGNDYYYSFKWTLQRPMDSNLVNSDNTKMDYEDTYKDEELVPWWQPEAKKQDGNDNRQGKMVGMDIVNTHALMGDLATAYPGASQFLNDNFYYAKTDSDDVITDKFKDPSSDNFEVVGEGAELQVPKNELWKNIPNSEAPNPVVDMVTWYQKAKHSYHNDVAALPINYKYDGYEIYEGNGNLNSVAPGVIVLKINGIEYEIAVNIESPLETNRFYNMYKANDEKDGIEKDKICTTDYLEVGFEEVVDPSKIDDIISKGGSFQLIYGREGSSPKDEEDYIDSSIPDELKKPSDMIPGRMYYTSYDILFDEQTGDLNLEIPDEDQQRFNGIPLVGGGLQHLFLTFKRTPQSEGVIIGGYDFWLTTKLKYTRSEAYHNSKDKNRMTSWREDISKKFKARENNVFIEEYLSDGYVPSKFQASITEVYVVEVGENMVFRTWDGAPYAMQPNYPDFQINYQVSSRRKNWRLNEEQSAKRIKWELIEYNPEGNEVDGYVKGTVTLQDFGVGDNMEIRHSFNRPGVYILRARLERKKSYYDVLIHVVPESIYKGDEVAVVDFRDLTDVEIGYFNTQLGEGNHNINKEDYKLAMVSRLKSEYAWHDGPRSYMKSDGSIDFIDRFGPYNDYAATYVYNFSNSVSNSYYNEQLYDDVKSYVTNRQKDFKVKDYYAHHFAPIRSFSTKFNLTIKDIEPSYIEDVFTTTKSNEAQYQAAVLDWKNNNFQHHPNDSYALTNVNSRLIYPWEVRLPWVNETKYYGTRIRTSIKTLMDVNEMKTRILSDWFEPVSKTPYPTIGFLDDDDEKREYEFFLNLKHNRWVIVSNTEPLGNMHFYHPLDDHKVIASNYVETEKKKSVFIVIGGDLVAGSIADNERPNFTTNRITNAYVYNPDNKEFVECAPDGQNNNGLNRFSLINDVPISGYSVAYPLVHYMRNYLWRKGNNEEVALIMAGKPGITVEELQNGYIGENMIISDNYFHDIWNYSKDALNIEGVELSGIIYFPTEEYDDSYASYSPSFNEDIYLNNINNLQKDFSAIFHKEDLKLYVVYDSHKLGDGLKNAHNNKFIKTIAVSWDYLNQDNFGETNYGIKKIGRSVAAAITNQKTKHSLIGGYGFNYSEEEQTNEHLNDVRRLVEQHDSQFIVTAGGDNYQYDANNGISCSSCPDSEDYRTPDPENDIDTNQGALFYDYGQNEVEVEEIYEINQYFPTLSQSDYKAPEYNDGDPNTVPDFNLENVWLDYFYTEQYTEDISNNPNASEEGKYYDFMRGNIQYFIVNNSTDYSMEAKFSAIGGGDISQLDARTTDALCAANANLDGAVTCKQYYWLKDKLESSNAIYKIVVMGRPPYSSAITKSPELMQQNLRLPFKDWGASIVISGGSAIYERLKGPDNLTYIVNGVGGYPDLEVQDAENNKSVYSEYLNTTNEWGAMFVEEQNDHLLFEFYNTNNEKKDWFELLPDGTVSTGNTSHNNKTIGQAASIATGVVFGAVSAGYIISKFVKSNKYNGYGQVPTDEELSVEPYPTDGQLGGLEMTELKGENMQPIRDFENLELEAVTDYDNLPKNIASKQEYAERYNATAEDLENTFSNQFKYETSYDEYSLLRTSNLKDSWLEFVNEEDFEQFKESFFEDTSDTPSGIRLNVNNNVIMENCMP